VKLKMAETRTKSEETGLTAAQQRALVALLSTPTHETAAKQAGLTSRTLRRYLRLPEFRAEYLARRREMMSSAIVLAQQNAVDMVQVQITIANDPSAPASVRVSAANNVYGIGDNGQKTEDIEARIHALEERLNELGIKTETNRKGAGYPFRG
jgi:hypothetical protein